MKNELNNGQLKRLGQEIADDLFLHPDRIGFYRTNLGMKTASGIALIILDKVEKILDENTEPVISGSHETKDSI